MKRLAFNGGEISPNMALRSDMDVFPRSCTNLTNFDVHATGGISRRKGFVTVANAIKDPLKPELGSILIPYIYSDGLVYLIEASYAALRVYNTATNTIVANFTLLDGWQTTQLNRVTWQQINSILLICAPDNQLIQLKMDAEGNWTLNPFQFKCPPWQTIDLQERDLTITPTDKQNEYLLTFAAEDTPEEKAILSGDLLRASYYIPRQEIKSGPFIGDNSFADTTTDLGVDESSHYLVGNKIAVREVHTTCYICVKEFDASRDFTQGCILPENYMADGDARFIVAEDLTGFNNVEAINGLNATTDYAKGDKLKVTHGYWKLYTCIRKFDGSKDYTNGHSLDNYPSHFLPGILINTPGTCRGEWKFHCSGTWYGSYEVRRCYTSTKLTDPWDTLGESFSRLGSPENNILTGDESDEECYLGLFLTRIRYFADVSYGAGWPPPYCQNALIISSYKHDMQLQCRKDETLGFIGTDVTPILDRQRVPFATNDWSWCAFNKRNGYPTLATVHESRLVLAATKAQPQTIWMSKTDDLNNFQTGKLDTSALHLTMSTTTQAAICWMLSRGEVIMLGTEDGEWIISSSSGQGLTPTTARIVNHGRVGSAHIPAVQAIDRVLYCERGSGRLYQYGFDWNSNSYTSTDLTIFADHIAADAGGITSGTVQRKPYTRAIFVLADGTLALMTYNTLHQVNAWHRYTTNGKFEAVCALPNGTQEDKLYAIVSRNGTRYLECMSEDSPYIDAGQYDYTSTVSTTALWPPDADELRTPTAPLDAYITTPTPAANITVRTSEGTPYSKINHIGNLTPGWIHLISSSTWTNRPHLSIRVTGNSPFTLLALQQ